MATNPIPVQVDYTSRDFASLRDDLSARVQTALPEWTSTDPADFGVVLVEAFAYMGDLMSYYIDRAANESTLSTATRTASVVALARDLGYSPAGYSPATVTVTFTNTSSSPITIPATTVVVANIQSADAIITIPFETDTDVTVSASSNASVSCTQGETRIVDGYGEIIGVSDGSVSLTLELPDSKVLNDSVVVYVYDGVNFYPWQRVTHLSDYSSLSRVFTVRDNGFQTFYVQFGDGVSGLIPSSGYVIFAEYRVVDGTKGNVPAGTITEITAVPGLTTSEVTVLAGTLTVTNDSASTGGSDPESLESIRYNASQVYRTNNRAVTLEDYQNVALSVPACGKASAASSVPGVVSVAVAPYRTSGSAEQRPGYVYDSLTSTWVETSELTSLKSNVLSKINTVALAGSTTSVVSPVYSDLLIGVSITALPVIRQSDANTIVKQAILEKLDYSRVGFGATIYINDIISLVTSLGVASSVSLTNLSRLESAPSTVDVTAAYNEVFLLTEDNLGVLVTGGADG